MPLIELWFRPGYRIKMISMQAVCGDLTSRRIIREDFASALPQLFIDNAEELMLTPGTPLKGVQVTNHDYSPDDVNPANIWLDIRFSEARPDEMRCQMIREKLFELIIGWFTARDMKPENLMMDLAWGPTHGKGTVDGVEIQW